jgi:hypothetical protein
MIMQSASPGTTFNLDSLDPEMFSDKTMSASQLYAQSLLMDMLKQSSRRKSKHSVARAQRARAKAIKRKAKK